MSKDRKTSRRKRNTIILFILLIPIFVGDIFIILQGKLPFLEMGIPLVLTFLLFITLFFFIKRKDGQKIEGDERNERIEGRAFTYSWCLSLYVVIILMLNDTLELFEISTSQCLFYILSVMLVTNLVFRATLNRKGDIEN
ncbi:MAG: hypothetical protein JW866_10015 [Ignavibacteriales bacterium]|nr:hypothetical protein [Ignavibacteriales bacterium]